MKGFVSLIRIAGIAGGRHRYGVLLALGGCAAFASAADAYVGPGAGLGVLGVMLAVVAAILMALVGMVLWPIRAVAHRRKAKARAGTGGARPRDTGAALDPEPESTRVRQESS